MRSSGALEDELLPLAAACALANLLAIEAKPSNKPFLASSSLSSKVSGTPKAGGGSLLLDDLAETAPLEMKFKAVTRATPPTVAEPSIVARVSDFCSDRAPTTPAVPPP